MSTIEAISTERALKLALEALNTTESDCGSRAWEREQEAITALREALTSVPDWASEAIEQPSGGATLAPVAKPHERNPLTCRQIDAIADEYLVDYRIPAGCALNFARDIEAAHGITAAEQLKENT